MQNESKLSPILAALLVAIAVVVVAYLVVFVVGLVMPLLKLVVLAGVTYAAFLAARSLLRG